QIKSHLRTLAPAPSTEEATKGTERRTSRTTSSGRPTGRAEAPSGSYRTYDVGNVFRVSVPSNWEQQEGNSTVTFTPPGAYGDSGFTHGMEFGVSRNETHDLQSATDELLNSLARGNPNLRKSSGYDRVAFGGRRGLHAVLLNR